MRFPPPAAAAALLLLAAGLLAGCPKGDPPAPKPGGGPAKPALDPAVVAALAKRPDLAKGRVYLLGLDGCDPRLVRARVEKGGLPNFKRLMDEGAFGPLRSQRPMLSPLLWTTVATGKWPTEHGVLDFLVRSRTDPKAREAVGGRNRQVEAIWDIAGRYGKPVGLVGWLASHPAEAVNGFAVSERTELLAYLFNEGVPPTDDGKTFPPGLLAEVAALRRRPADITYEEAKPFLHVTPEEWKAACTEDRFTAANRTNNLRLILTAADNFRRVDARLWKDRRPGLFCAYFEMLDAVSHNFMAYRDPVTWLPRDLAEVQEAAPRFGLKIDPAAVEKAWKWARGEGPREGLKGVDPQIVATIAELARGAAPEDAARWKDAVDAAYDWTDRLLGEVMASCDADTTLLVVSDHGFASGSGGSPLDAPKPPFDSSFQSRLGGANFHMENGVLGAWGRGVRKGFAIPLFDREPAAGARLLDVAPTALALLGFPKAKDMPGRVVAEIFDLDLAVGTVETYEAGRSTRLAKQAADEESRKDPAAKGRTDPSERDIDDFMKQLTAVGYVGTAEEGPTRALVHMAASYEEQGRYAEAEEAMAEALKVAKGPEKADLLVRMGDLRLRMKDPAGARRRYGESLKEDPGFMKALVGLARLADDGDDPSAAVAAWERVVAQDPKFQEPKVRLADALRTRAESSPATAQEDLRRALSLIREAVKSPDAAAKEEDRVTAGGHNLVGKVLLRTGDFAGAMEHFRKAAEMKPDFLPPRTNLGVLHLNLANQFRQMSEAPGAAPEAGERMRQNRAEALRWFGEVLSKGAEGETRARALYNRAEVNWYIPPRDLAAAEKDLLEALKAAPDYKRAQALLDKVRKESGSK